MYFNWNEYRKYIIILLIDENYEHKTNSDYTHVSTEKNSVYRDSDKQQRNEMQIVVIHQDLEEDEGKEISKNKI